MTKLADTSRALDHKAALIAAAPGFVTSRRVRLRSAILFGTALSGVLVGVTPLAARAQTPCSTTVTQSCTNSGSIGSNVTITGSNLTFNNANTGNISANSGSAVTNNGSGVTINNAGGISAWDSSSAGINNRGTITALDNSGSIGSQYYSIQNSGLITTLTNESGGYIYGIQQEAGTITTMINDGTISEGINNNGSISTLFNESGGQSTGGISNYASITTLNNAGTISGGGTNGFFNSGTITTLNNESGGVIIGGFFNQGFVGGGSIAVSLASGSTFNGALSNIGTIAGNIINNSTQALTISGWDPYSVGTLTGYNNAVGTINSAAGVDFTSFSMVLNDDITAVSVTNSGADLLLGGSSSAKIITINGDYTQSANGTLEIGIFTSATTPVSGKDYSQLVVNGNANLKGILQIDDDLFPGTITAGTAYDVVVTHNGSITGTFSTITLGNWLGNYLTPSQNLIDDDILAVTLGIAAPAGCNSPITSSCTNSTSNNTGFTITGSNLTFNNANTGNISVSSGNAVTNNGSGVTLTNEGTISGGTYGSGTGATTGTGIANLGTITTLTNNGSISALSTNGTGINNGGSIATLTNEGGISAGLYGAGDGIKNSGSITTLTNEGSIGASAYGITNTGTITTLDNSGSINSRTGIYNNGTITTLTNEGSITGGVYNLGLIGGGSVAVSLASGSSLIGGISNSGTIAGNILNDSSQTLDISGGVINGIIGTLSGANGSVGTITSAAGVDFTGGSLVLNDNITANSIADNGANLLVDGSISTSSPLTITSGVLDGTGTLTGNVINNTGFVKPGGGSSSVGILTINGNYSQGSNGTLEIGIFTDSTKPNPGTDYSQLLVNGNASLNGILQIDDDLSSGTITAGTAYDVVVTHNGSITGTFSSVTLGGGLGNYLKPVSQNLIDDDILAVTLGIAAPAGCNSPITSSCTNSTSIGSNVTITGSNLTFNNANTGNISVSSGNAVTNSGSGVTLTNEGTISGGTYGSGTGATTGTGIANLGTITTLTNNGSISALSTNGTGINNGGSIATLTNEGGISAGMYGTGGGIKNSGSITTLTNSGSISAGAYGITNTGAITMLTNKGNIISYVAINNSGSIATLDNSGSISGSINGIYNGVTITMLTNEGSITGGINNFGLIGGGSVAVSLASGSSLIGGISNSGIIEGNIVNDSNQMLAISGSTIANRFGTLTGYNNAVGTINSAAGVTFTGGNLVLNDDITAASVTNSGADLLLGGSSSAKIITISGDYTQSSTGTLEIGIFTDSTKPNPGTDYSQLSVNGNASLKGILQIDDDLSSGTITAGTAYDVVVTHNGSITGTFNSVGLAPGLSKYLTASQNLIDGDILAVTLGIATGGGQGGGNGQGGGEGGSCGITVIPTSCTNTAPSSTTQRIVTGNNLTFTNAGGITVASGSALTNAHTGVALVNNSNVSGPTGISNNEGGEISSLVNSGTISGTTGAGVGIANAGTISGGINNAGTISGANAAVSLASGSSLIGGITNAGTIAGNIINNTSQTLNIAGASAGSGTLTGYTNVGSITSNAAGVNFTGGNLTLNDDVTAPAVTNSGANLLVNGTIAVSAPVEIAQGALAIGDENNPGAQLKGSVALAGGLLRGHGSISGDVTNNGGTVAPGGSVGILTVDSNFSQGANGILQEGIYTTSNTPKAGTDYDQLIVNGNVTLGGTLAIEDDLPAGATLSPGTGGTVYDVVISKNGTITGTFSTISLGALGNYLSEKADYSPQTMAVTLSLAGTDTGTGSGSGSGSGTGTGTGTGAAGDYANPDALAFATGRFYAASLYAQSNALRSALTAPLDPQARRTNAAQGYWLSAIGNFGSANGNRFNTEGFVLGRGFAVSRALVIGGGISNVYTHSGANGSSVNNTEAGGLVYGSYHADRLQLSASIGAGYASNRLNRFMPYVNWNPKSSNDGAYIGTAARADYQLLDASSPYFLAPYATADYTHLSLGAAREHNTGFSALNLQYNSLKLDLVQIGAGLTGGYSLPVRDGTLKIWGSIGGSGTLGNAHVAVAEHIPGSYYSREQAFAAPVAALRPGLGVQFAGRTPWRLSAQWNGQFGSAISAQSFAVQGTYNW